MMCSRLLLLLMLQPLIAQANCEQLWDVSALVKTHAADATLEFGMPATVKIPMHWLQGINIISKKIDATSAISTTLYLCNGQYPNAFAWREGERNAVALTTGMYRLLGNDWHAYAVLIGHENAHLVKNHGRERQKREAEMAIGQMLLAPVLAQNSAGLGGIVSDITALGISAIGASYSRDEEREADKYGILYAYCAGFSPEGAIRLHRKLDSASNFLSSHPSSRQRIATLHSLIGVQKRNPDCI